MIFNSNYFWLKKIDNFDLYNVLLAIATNNPVQLMSSFVVQGHIYIYIIYIYEQYHTSRCEIWLYNGMAVIHL